MTDVLDPGIDQLLDRIIEVFQNKGYTDASIQDLVKATGWNRTSLYGAFGNKAGLFAAALDRYVERRPLGALTIDADVSFPEAIAIALAEIVNGASGERRIHGCILFGIAGSIDQLDPALADRVRTALVTAEALLASRVAVAQEAGEIAFDGNPEALTRYLVAIVLGLRATALRTGDKVHLAVIAEAALRILD